MEADPPPLIGRIVFLDVKNKPPATQPSTGFTRTHLVLRLRFFVLHTLSSVEIINSTDRAELVYGIGPLMPG